MKKRINQFSSPLGLLSLAFPMLFFLQGCEKEKAEYPRASVMTIQFINRSDEDVHMYVLNTNGEDREKIGPENKVSPGESREFIFVCTWSQEGSEFPFRVAIGKNGLTIFDRQILIKEASSGLFKYWATWKNGTLTIDYF